MTTLIQYAPGLLLNSCHLLSPVFQSAYLLQAPCSAPCRHVGTLLAALQLSSPTEKVLQSLLGPIALGEAGIEPECSNQDMVNIQPSSQLCSILNEIYNVESWIKLWPKKIILRLSGAANVNDWTVIKIILMFPLHPIIQHFIQNTRLSVNVPSRYTLSCFLLLCTS